ncbi:MAG TPA: hypothetical protein VJ724_01230 [Tahibacter sp.]|nr:hypothetical protein [Tahibacter sp.]
MSRSMLRLAAAAALVFSVGSAQAEQTQGTPSYYGGSARLINPGNTVWTGASVAVTDSTYPGCAQQLQDAIDYRLDQGYQLVDTNGCHIVYPGIVIGATPVDRVFTRDEIANVIDGTTVLRERYRIDQFEADVQKLYPPRR